MLRVHPVLLSLARQKFCHFYATVSPSLVNLGGLPPPPGVPTDAPPSIQPPLDNRILDFISSGKHVSLRNLVHSYLSNSGRTLDTSLLYESRPSAARKVNWDSPNYANMLLIAHCVRNGDEHKVTVASGFALEAPSPRNGESLILSCAHTLEEASSFLSFPSGVVVSSRQIRRSPLMLKANETDPRRVSSGSFVLSSDGGIYPVTDIVSSLPRSDLIIMSCAKPPVATLPVSPYPVHPETRISCHLISHEHPQEPGWSRWIGNSWSKWVRGVVSGYRDFAGREAMPGTYDALSHLLFMPLPTAGSSGGPLIDEETGAVIGVMLGTRMDNRVEGMKGWGAPSESIFEMFSLPGLEGKK
ncbi:hypothetical protein GYMLUDRAFT_148604 [Collybiopsis luxurians FD-317 M1]|nr:hypothetical protein GYMLUDRAFT_148604 [Collybiopsis luxurians FD-317 M1]